MNNYKKYCCNQDTTVMEVLRLLEKTHKKIMLVEKNGELEGIVTDGDIRRHLLASGALDAQVGEIMNRNPVFLREDEASKANECMNENGIDAIPIVNHEGYLCDIVFRYPKYQKQKLNTQLNLPVIIMAGGKGTRLLPYTNILPKPLMPLSGKTVLECIIDTFYAYGCEKFSLILNYKKELIKAYLNDVNSAYGLEYIEEPFYMGTGGGLYYIKNRVNTTFIVSNCDVVLNIDYAEALEYHQKRKNIMTIIAAYQDYSIPYGTIQTDENGEVRSLCEKPRLKCLVNTGVYIMEPGILADLEEKGCDMTDIIAGLIGTGKKVGVFSIDGRDWMDVGEIKGLVNALE